MASLAGGVRRAAVAGMFYPEDPVELRLMLEDFLSDAQRRAAVLARKSVPDTTSVRDTDDATTGWPKALIVPHAGYVYSGPIAASGYARLLPGRSIIRRAVLIGPAHRLPLRGLAASSARAFETPLGLVRVDHEWQARALELPQVSVVDEAHAQEHSLEVHLPFLQTVLRNFQIVSLLVGKSTPEEVGAVISRLWGGPETLIVVSSDLSHYHDDTSAKSIDAETSRLIEQGDEQQLSGRRACGYLSVGGLLQNAQQRRLRVHNVDLRTSADTAGPRDRVVGYGAFVVEPDAENENERMREGEIGSSCSGRVASRSTDPSFALPPLPSVPPLLGTSVPSSVRIAGSVVCSQPEVHSAEERQFLLRIAAEAIRVRAFTGGMLQVGCELLPPRLREVGATFVTLRRDGRLRGCVGSVHATEMITENVARSAVQAAFADRRFPRLEVDELPGLEIHVSILTPTRPITFFSEEELLSELRPGVDGVTLREGRRFGLFLPSVWKQVPDAVQFLRHLKRKAGLPEDYWSETILCERFEVEEFEGVVGETDGQDRSQ
nr:K821 [uncultured bacterium]